MTLALTDDDVLFLRLWAQGLRNRDWTSAACVAKAICGVQAQDAEAARLAIRARTRGIGAANVEREMQEHALLRTWCMRGTLHLLAADDLERVVPLLGPRVILASRRRRRQLGLETRLLHTATAHLRRFLADSNALTRDEIAAKLSEEGVQLEGQALYHFLRHVCLQGITCIGPDRGRDPTYMLTPPFNEIAGEGEREAALQELARRYLTAYGPAGFDDFVAWSGLGKREARTGWMEVNSEALEVRVRGQPARMLKGSADLLDEKRAGSEPFVRLLPGYDAYLLGYRDRAMLVPPQYVRRVHPGGGVLRPTVLVNGRVEGTWRLRRGRELLQVEVGAFHEFTPEVRASLGAEVDDVGRFFGLEAELRLTKT